MASFSNTIQRAAGAITAQATATAQSARASIRGTERGALNAAGSAAFGAAKGAIGNAAGALFDGNPQGALDALFGAPNDVIDALTGVGQAAVGNVLQGINARQDAVLSTNWYCSLPDLAARSAPGSSYVSALKNLGRNMLGMNDLDGTTLPWYYVDIASLPFRQFDTHTVHRQGHNITLPKSYSMSGNLSMNFFLDESGRSLRYLRTWQGRVLANRTPSGRRTSGRSSATTSSDGNGLDGSWGRPGNGSNGFFRDVTFVILSVNRDKLVTLTYHDCWPVSLPNLDLASDTATKLQFQVEFACNDMSWGIEDTKTALDLTRDLVKSSAVKLAGKIARRLF